MKTISYSGDGGEDIVQKIKKFEGITPQMADFLGGRPHRKKAFFWKFWPKGIYFKPIFS